MVYNVNKNKVMPWIRCMPEVCGLWTRISADLDPQIFLRTRTVHGSAKQTHLRTRTICGSKAMSIVCTTNLERKCQCTSSQQFENWSIFGHCSRLCKEACLTVWALGIFYWIQCNLTLFADAGGGTWVAITVVDVDRPQTWCLRTRIIRGREICGFAHLWCMLKPRQVLSSVPFGHPLG